MKPSSICIPPSSNFPPIVQITRNVFGYSTFRAKSKFFEEFNRESSQPTVLFIDVTV